MTDKYFNPLTKGNRRNAQCPCGSGKKVKSCHGGKTFLTREEVETLKNEIQKAKESKID